MDEEKMIRYLLGELDGVEEAEVEERFISDAAFFEQICAAEDELIEDYLTGALGSRILRQFEKAYLESPERRKRVEGARDLRETLKMRLEPEQAVLRPAPQPDAGTTPASGILAFLLLPGVARGAGESTQVVRIDPGMMDVCLDLELNTAEDFRAYRTVLQSSGGDILARSENLAAASTEAGAVISWKVSASHLAAGDYLLALHGDGPDGTELIDNYHFRVRRSGAPST